MFNLGVLNNMYNKIENGNRLGHFPFTFLHYVIVEISFMLAFLIFFEEKPGFFYWHVVAKFSLRHRKWSTHVLFFCRDPIVARFLLNLLSVHNFSILSSLGFEYLTDYFQGEEALFWQPYILLAGFMDKIRIQIVH